MAEPLAPRPRPALRVIVGGATESPPSYSDAELFEGIAAGDDRIAAALYRRLVPGIEAALDSLLGRREARSQVLIQGSFERVVLTLADRRYAEACSLSTWSTALAVQVAMPALRARSRRRITAPRAVHEPSVPSQREASVSEARSADVDRASLSRRDTDFLRGCLAELPSAQAEAIALHEVLGLQLADIATILRISLATLQTRLVRGRKQLRARLAQRGRTGLSSQRTLENALAAWKNETATQGRSLTVGTGSRQLGHALRRVARRRRQRQRVRTFGVACAAVASVFAATAGVWFGARQPRASSAPEHSAEPRVLLGGVFGDVSISDGDGRLASGALPSRPLPSVSSVAGLASSSGLPGSGLPGSGLSGSGLSGSGKATGSAVAESGLPPSSAVGGNMVAGSSVGGSVAGGTVVGGLVGAAAPATGVVADAADGALSLGEGYGLRTGEGNAQLGFPSGASVRVSSHSRVAILSARDGEVVFLGSGSAEVEVPPAGFGSGFVVETPDARLGARASRFGVVVDASRSGAVTRLDVKAGRVSVEHAGQELEIKAGQSWPVVVSPDPQ